MRCIPRNKRGREARGQDMAGTGRTVRWAGALAGAVTLAGCGPGGLMDLDLRRGGAGGLDTSGAVREAPSADRPQPDANGLISYPTYQVAVARRGDTVASVASRIGLPAGELATFNGLRPEDALNRDAVLALPRRVGPGGTNAGTTDIASIAGAAIDRAGTGTRPTTAAAGVGREPVRHRVARGETAFSIARLYGVSPAALADWNGLGSDLAVREGQFLLIPLASAQTAGADATVPGQGSATPIPPSASSALPEQVEEVPLPQSPNLDQFRTETSPEAAAPAPPAASPQASSSATLRQPVQGSILRAFSASNEGVDYRAAEGTAVTAAASGMVAAITRDTDQVPILVLRHADGLLTVYANIKDIRVSKDDTVTAGQRIASVGAGDPPFLHFEVRRGFDAIDPATMLR